MIFLLQASIHKTSPPMSAPNWCLHQGRPASCKHASIYTFRIYRYFDETLRRRSSKRYCRREVILSSSIINFVSPSFFHRAAPAFSASRLSLRSPSVLFAAMFCGRSSVGISTRFSNGSIPSQSAAPPLHRLLSFCPAQMPAGFQMAPFPLKRCGAMIGCLCCAAEAFMQTRSTLSPLILLIILVASTEDHACFIVEKSQASWRLYVDVQCTCMPILRARWPSGGKWCMFRRH
jgi:hypothetical protein